MFKSINETDKFRYDDCIINKFVVDDKGILMEVEALIVKAENSQNSNYTESYAADTTITMNGAKITKVIKDGYKRYDANDNLIEKVEDVEVSFESEKFMKLFEGQCLLAIDCIEDRIYEIRMGLYDEDPTVMTDSYCFVVECPKVDITWERYMNRVG